MPHSTGLRPPAARRPRALPVPTIGASAGPPGDSHALVRALLSAVRARQDQFLGLPVEPRPDGALTHLVAMPHVTRGHIDRLTADLAAAARVRQPKPAAPPRAEADRCTP